MWRLKNALQYHLGETEIEGRFLRTRFSISAIHFVNPGSHRQMVIAAGIVKRGGILTEVDFYVPELCDLAGAEKLIERACSKRGLSIAIKGSLKGYPGCVHWHYKKQPEKGTLEITLYPKARRIWAQVQDGRRAPWIVEELPRLQREVEGELQRECGPNLLPS